MQHYFNEPHEHQSKKILKKEIADRNFYLQQIAKCQFQLEKDEQDLFECERLKADDSDGSIEYMFKSYADPRLKLIGCQMGNKARCMDLQNYLELRRKG